MKIRRPRPTGVHVNVTPMIDVVMVLIIFYLIVGQLASDRRSTLELPRSTHGHDRATPDPLIINLLSDRTMLVEDELVSSTELGMILRSRVGSSPDLEIQVRASRSLPFATLRPVLALCRDAGVDGITIATEPS